MVALGAWRLRRAIQLGGAYKVGDPSPPAEGKSEGDSQRIIIFRRRESFGVEGFDDSDDSGKAIVAIGRGVAVEVCGRDGRREPLVEHRLENQVRLAVADMNRFLNRIAVETAVETYLAEVSLRNIAASIGEWVKDGNGVAVNVVFCPGGLHERFRVRWVDPIAFQSQIPNRHS